jgi:hypothetical protein
MGKVIWRLGSWLKEPVVPYPLAPAPSCALQHAASMGSIIHCGLGTSAGAQTTRFKPGILI